MRSEVGVLPSRSSSQVAWCRRPRSAAKIACIWVNWSDDAVVATSELSPTGMPSLSAFCAGAQPWPIWSSICGASDTLPPESRTICHSSSNRCDEWM